ncbi:hypothetical protein BGZ75_000997 [Mortierella antarctica]|nr:hypothetical protein BGZ75_000997 [Mortierella antarctica]
MGSSSQEGARTDIKKRSSKNRPSRSQTTSLALSSVVRPRKPSKKRKIEDQGYHHKENEKSTLVHISQPLARDHPHSLSRMGDKEKEHESPGGDVPIKSGRWSATEDAALFQGVRNHLASLGFEPQPPVNLPSEMELRKHNESTSGALATASLQGHRREPFSGAITEDSTFFDSIVDASYYVDGIDGSHGFSVETHPLVLDSAMPHSGSSGTPQPDALDVGNSIARTPSEASTVVRNGSQLGLEHYYEQHPRTKFSVDLSGQTILSGALFEALSVAASHIRTPEKRDQSDIPQDGSGDSSGGDETISGQLKDDQQVQSASLAAWPHPLQRPPSPRALHQPVDVSRHAWTFPGLLQAADSQLDSHQIVSHPQHNPYSTLTYSQNLSVPTNLPFNCATPLMQNTAMGLTLQQQQQQQQQQQEQRGNSFDSGNILAVDDYWYPPSGLHLDSILLYQGPQQACGSIQENTVSTSKSTSPIALSTVSQLYTVALDKTLSFTVATFLLAASIVM